MPPPTQPSAEGPDAATQLRPEAVLELGFLLRKVIDARAQYSAEHPNTRTAIQKLHERITLVLRDFASLTFDVHANAFLVADKPLQKTQADQDVLAQTLFGDGARKVVFTRGLTPAQLMQFFDVAARARHAGSDQSVMTAFWEAELANVQFVVATTFADEGTEGLEADAPGRRVTQAEQIAGVMNVFSSPELTATFNENELPTMITLSNNELEVLSSKTLSGIDQEALKAHAAAARDSVLSVDQDTLRALHARLSQPRGDASERLLSALFDAAVTAPSDLKPRVVAQLQQVVEGMLTSNRLEPCARAISQLLQAARNSPAVAQQHLPVLNQVRQALAPGVVVDHLLSTLEDPNLAPHAIPLLRIFGALALDRIFDALGRLKTDEGKANVSKLLALINPKPDVLALRAKTATPEVAQQLVLLCNKQPPNVATPILGAMLQSSDAAIRRVAVRTMERTIALGMSALLRKMIGDPDRDVRLNAVRLLGYAEDQASVDAMGRTLTRASTDALERREVYRALGEIGGAAAADVLTAELGRQQDLELRISLVGCFGRAWSPKAAAAVNELAGRLLGNPKLRQACKAAVAKAEAAAKVAAAETSSSPSGLFRGKAP